MKGSFFSSDRVVHTETSLNRFSSSFKINTESFLTPGSPSKQATTFNSSTPLARLSSEKFIPGRPKDILDAQMKIVTLAAEVDRL